VKDIAPVSVSRRIPASAVEIFAILADPDRHSEIDGSGMLRGAVDPKPVSAVGDVFVMKMHHHEFGDYEMSNTVVEFQPNRLITWEPARLDAEPWHYRWRYELVPGAGGGTDVTESFDLSHSPEAARQATHDGTVWIEAIEETLERLEHLCSRADTPKAG
jgi:hypothetical protein